MQNAMQEHRLMPGGDCMCRTRKLALARPRLRMCSAASRAECSWREDIVEESKVEWGVLGGRVGVQIIKLMM